MRKYLIISLVFILLPASIISAAVMSSQNYKIQSDSVNIGGARENSASFRMEDTIGEIATGHSRSANYRMHAGFQQMQEVYISITDLCSGSVDMGSLPGLSGGATDDDGVALCQDYTTFNVKTDDPAGYSLKVRAEDSPALQHVTSTAYFADYSPAGIDPDYEWNLDTNSEFGFSPYNLTSQAQKYKNNNSNCNAGTNITDRKCWYYFSASDENIVNRPDRTTPSGEDSTLNLKAAITTSGGFQEEGPYGATLVITAITN